MEINFAMTREEESDFLESRILARCKEQDWKNVIIWWQPKVEEAIKQALPDGSMEEMHFAIVTHSQIVNNEKKIVIGVFYNCRFFIHGERHAQAGWERVESEDAYRRRLGKVEASFISYVAGMLIFTLHIAVEQYEASASESGWYPAHETKRMILLPLRSSKSMPISIL